MTLLSCEHAGNEVPDQYRELFAPYERLLGTHRGWDPGALGIAMRLGRLIEAPLHVYTFTRLLIEANRSLHHPDLFSFITQTLPEEERDSILANYYLPYRSTVESAVQKGLEAGPVHHFSIHSFTPVYDGKPREVQIGLLYDPASKRETTIAHKLQAYLQSRSTLCICMNQPYLGTDDGFTTYLRAKYPENYAGIEIEISQGIIGSRADEIAGLLAEGIRGI